MSICSAAPTGTRCPHCLSLAVQIVHRPCVGMESDGDTTYMINSSMKRCLSCGYLWDRVARRGLGLQNYPQVHPQSTPGVLTRLFRRIFAFIS